MRTRLLCCGLLATALLAAGCGGDDDDADVTGPAAPSASAAATTDPAEPFGPVRNPRDASPVRADPCGGFTPDQLAAYRIDQPGEARMSEVSGYPRCRWQDSGSTRQLALEFNSIPEGLDNAYANRGWFQRFEVLEVGGNPAVLGQALAGGPECGVTVLTTETDQITASFATLGAVPEEPCAKARELAQTALENLTPLQ